MTDRDDKVYKKWADGYVEQYGQTLLNEQKMLDEQRISYAMPHADARIRQLAKESRRGTRLKRSKRSRRAPFFAAAAALLLVFIGASTVWTLMNTPLLDVLAPSQGSSTQGSPTDTGPTNSSDTIRPLDFTLPAQFSVASVEWDNGETIYHLDNRLYDDAVLTIREPERDTSWMQGLDEIIIDGTAVPAKLRDEYKLLTFVNGGTLYTISCRDDIETLSTLYRSITAAGNQ